MSTNALHILELMKTLPPAEREFLRSELTKADLSGKADPASHWQRTADGGYYNPAGIPNDDPIFKVLETVEEERHKIPGPPPPEFD